MNEFAKLNIFVKLDYFSQYKFLPNQHSRYLGKSQKITDCQMHMMQGWKESLLNKGLLDEVGNK